MENKVKDSLTVTRGERSSIKLLTRESVTVCYCLETDSLIYHIPSGYTIGDLKDWRVKNSADVLKAFYKKKVEPSERMLRELSLINLSTKKKGGKK